MMAARIFRAVVVLLENSASMTDAIRKLIKYVFGKDPGGETIRYLFVGAMTTLVNYGLFELLHSLVGLGVTASNIIAISASIIFAYVANKLIVFRRRSGSPRELALEFFKFVGSRLFTMGLEVGIVELFYRGLDADARLGKVVAQVFVIIANYFISKLIVFEKSGDET